MAQKNSFEWKYSLLHEFGRTSIVLGNAYFQHPAEHLQLNYSITYIIEWLNTKHMILLLRQSDSYLGIVQYNARLRIFDSQELYKRYSTTLSFIIFQYRHPKSISKIAFISIIWNIRISECWVLHSYLTIFPYLSKIWWMSLLVNVNGRFET